MNLNLTWERFILFIRNFFADKFRKPQLLLLLSFCLLSFFANAQKTITGRVEADDSPLAGATIQVKGSTVSTVSKADGTFAINAPAKSTLVISFIGYVEKEVKVGNSSFVNVELERSDKIFGAKP